jgi:hypothetical protein
VCVCVCVYRHKDIHTYGTPCHRHKDIQTYRHTDTHLALLAAVDDLQTPAYARVCVCMCVYACVCVGMCVHACLCVRVGVGVCVCVWRMVRTGNCQSLLVRERESVCVCARARVRASVERESVCVCVPASVERECVCARARARVRASVKREKQNDQKWSEPSTRKAIHTQDNVHSSKQSIVVNGQ